MKNAQVFEKNVHKTHKCYKHQGAITLIRQCAGPGVVDLKCDDSNSKSCSAHTTLMASERCCDFAYLIKQADRFVTL